MVRNDLTRFLSVVALAASLAACRQKAVETASATTTPGPAEAPTAMSTAADPSASLEPRTGVTVDPVEASQRNASRRRDRGTSRPSVRTGEPDTAVVRATPSRSGDAGSSDDRQSLAAREVPSGTILRVKLERGISTATAKVGDTVSGELLDDLLADDDSVAVASGSRVRGKVEHVVDSGKLARPAELRFRLVDIQVGGRTVPVSTSAYQRTGDTHTKRNTGYIAGGAAVGAILGQLLGKDTESTLKGAAAGAAAGTGVAAMGGDLDFEIEAGRPVAFTLEEPLRVAAR